jgi:hypothetical protein
VGEVKEDVECVPSLSVVVGREEGEGEEEEQGSSHGEAQSTLSSPTRKAIGDQASQESHVLPTGAATAVLLSPDVAVAGGGGATAKRPRRSNMSVDNSDESDCRRGGRSPSDYDGGSDSDRSLSVEELEWSDDEESGFPQH